MEQIYERQYQDERQTRIVAKCSASESKRESNENVTLLIIRTRPPQYHVENTVMIT